MKLRFRPVRRAVTALIVLIATHASAAPGAVVEYRMLIDGVQAASHILTPGTHQLTVEGRVTDNVIAPGVHGGFLLYSFHLDELGPGTSLTFAQTTFTTGGGLSYAAWNSTAHPAFQHFNGILGDLARPGTSEFGIEVFEETGALPPQAWDTNFAIGAESFTALVTGAFDFNGTATVLELRSFVNVNSVVTLQQGILRGAYPASVVGDLAQIVPVPEPTGGMAALVACLAGVSHIRRRR
jgi:hypothetical protein